MELLKSNYAFSGQKVNAANTYFISGTKKFDRLASIKEATGYFMHSLLSTIWVVLSIKED